MEFLVSRHDETDAPKLHRLIDRVFSLGVAAYGSDVVTPKWHYALHLPDQLRRYKRSWNTLRHERKHKLFKELAANITNTRNFEVDVFEFV